MPTATYIPLATITLSSTDTDVTFANIPNTYKDLVIIASLRNTYPGSTEDVVQIQLNGDTGSNYSYVQMHGNGSSTFSVSGTGTNMVLGRMNEANTTAGQFSTNIFHFFDYAATDKHKTALGRADVPNFRTQANAGRWANTSAITSIKIFNSGANLASGCVLSLYGIAG